MDKLAALIEQNRLGLSVSDFELRVTERRIIIKAPYLQLCLLHKLLRDSDTTAVVKSSPETSFVTAVIEYAPVNSAEHTDFIALNTKLKDPTLNNVLSQLQFTEMPTVEIKEALDAIYIRCARNSRLCISSASCSGALQHPSVTIFRIDPVGIYVSTEIISVRTKRSLNGEEERPPKRSKRT